MRKLRFARANNGARKNQWITKQLALRVGIGLLAWGGVCLILLGANLFPGRRALRLGEPSPELIRAPRRARYVDQGETERLRREAERRVPPQYTPLPFAAQDAEQRVGQDFDLLTTAVATGEVAKLQSNAPWAQDYLDWLEETGPDDLVGLEESARSITREVMSKEIREGTADLPAAREEVARLAEERLGETLPAGLLSTIVARQIRATHRYDEEATEAAQAEARERIQEVTRTIEADQAIVFEGERVTRETMEMLRAVGLVSPRPDYRLTLATILIAGLIVLLLGLQTRHWTPKVYDQTKLLILLALLLLAPLFVINLTRLALPHVWVLLVPAVALMGAALLTDSVGMGLALALSLLVGMMANVGLSATLLSLGSAVAALAFSSQVWPVSRLRLVVGTMSLVNLVLVAAVGLLDTQPAAIIVREAGLAALLYSPGAAILALGGVYVLQRPFGITTHLGLLELSNPKAPLLKRLQTDAPGTYHHAMMVANLAETAAEAIGADPLLTRVGALYHDIGKLYRPTFFVENLALLGLDNIHDRLSSSLSGLIIISHVKDGVALAQEHHLPPELVSIIAEHHGSTMMSYFYQQALASSRPEQVKEEQFRYPGPLPKSKESALVMLADGVHAAVKSLPEATPQRVQQMVKDIFRERVMSGQLARCELTLHEVALTEENMGKVLTAALCRDRVPYPEPVESGAGL